jgi:hypothetical protein
LHLIVFFIVFVADFLRNNDALINAFMKASYYWCINKRLHESFVLLMYQ